MDKKKEQESKEVKEEVKKKVSKSKKGKTEEKPSEVSQTVAPKPKRFENHNLAFAYFLKMIYFGNIWDYTLNRFTPNRYQRRLLKEIAEATLTRGKWLLLPSGSYELVTEDTKLEEYLTKPVWRTSFTKEEYLEIISWELIDYHVRMILERKSFLTRSRRDFLLEVFSWVDNFVAKEGEEVTMTIEDLKKIDSTEDILRKAQETLEQAQKED